MDPFSNKQLKTILVYLIVIFVIYSCKSKKPDVSEKIITDTKKLNAAGSVQLEDLLTNKTTDVLSKLNLKNTLSVAEYYKKNEYELKWTDKGVFTSKADSFLSFIKNNCKYYGLFPKSYNYAGIHETVEKLKTTGEKTNSVLWAKADAIFTDAFFQVVKHIKYGRLYNDTNDRYLDTTMHNTVLEPALTNYFAKSTISAELAKYEPKFSEYDSLKIAVKNLLAKNNKSYTYVKYPIADTPSFYTTLVKRIGEDVGEIKNFNSKDSFVVAEAVKKWQISQGLVANGTINADLVAAMNETGLSKFSAAALSMDKLKKIKITHEGNYVMVNIPSYYLRAYKDGQLALESKVAVGKSSTKTPEMESEISQLILMPNWYVPPSILKIPGYIERHRSNKNFIVKGKTVIQKSGPGNALGEMKFNFKSSDAIYLHDTNERYVFGSSRRAVSHGCVRVQQYKNLGDYIARVSPIYEQQFKRVVDKYEYQKDSLGRIVDSSAKYKYVPTDSTQYNGDSVITRLLRNKIHREITVGKKVPIYIKYFTCAARNGNLVIYPDVYGYDKELIEKYFKDIAL